MQVQYALYERNASGYCWTWRATGLPESLLNDFRYRVVLPNDSNLIATENLRGGICKFDRIVDSRVEEHVVFYRFFDGGTDAGRPNRVVMLTAWTSPEQVSQMRRLYSVASILRNTVFEYVAVNSRTVGIQPPPFCVALTTDEESPADVSRRVPSAALVEFCECLADKDSNCELRILDDQYAFQKKPSAACERRVVAEDASKNENRDDGADVGSHGFGTNGPDHRAEGKGAKRLGRQTSGQRGGMGKMVALFSAVTLSALAVGWAAQYGKWSGWGETALSASGEEVLRRFRELPANEQRSVLTRLEQFCEEQQLPEKQQIGPDYGGPASQPPHTWGGAPATRRRQSSRSATDVAPDARPSGNPRDVPRQ